MTLNEPVEWSVMNVDEKTKREILARVKQTSEGARQLQVEMQNAAEARADAVRMALDAGIPRSEIAKAAGVARTMIYRIAAE